MKKVWAWIKDDKGKIKYKLVEKKEYNIREYKFRCRKCGYSDSYLANQKIESFHFCPTCSKKSGAPLIYLKNIPTWRLNVEYASPKEILTKSWDEFGVPYMSEEQWKDFYNQPHERERRKELKKKKVEEALEAMEKSLKSKDE